MGKILIAGGAGYIGSHMVRLCLDNNLDVVTLDNLSAGHRDAVQGGIFIEGDLGDRELLDKLFSEHEFDTVMHFAACIEVGESVKNPVKYYNNNVLNTLTLLGAMIDHGVKHFIFSSTAAIFGNPVELPISETHPAQPINPYGRSKLMVEQMLKDFANAYDFSYASLRYFNAAGAHPDGSLGERHEPESHLIPLVLQAASGKRDSISVFGRNYDTPDGTCIRDYVHIVDLCQAHLLAMKWLQENEGNLNLNLGNGDGFSVQEVIDMARQVTGIEIKIIDADRRSGDPERLVANASLAKEILGWKPAYPQLETIIRHAWNWEKAENNI